ncbi:hypothetical protein [Streptomyces sp. RFCAC02]|uniref:hypothetical protein n=1 Tax=Streptomyces sp. RFCAC02 TaxID=2499143 RepID=UPI0010226814|nr:hypothetical protein [Streptomyces sp. RFCAC02]
MGIEGEQLVLDYLSRVGDLAHGTSMSAAQRAALVNRLRDDIHRARAAAGTAESRASVRRILGRMGSPEDVVAAAAGTQGAPRPGAGAPAPAPSGRPDAPSPAVPLTKPGRPADGSAEPGEGPAVPLPAQRTGDGGASLFPRPAPPGRTFWPDGDIGAFRGGIEIPEMLRPPLGFEDDEDAEDEADGPAAGGPVRLTRDEWEAQVRAAQAAEAEAAAAAARKAGPAAGRRLARAAFAGRRVGGVVELGGVLLLVAGAVLSELVLLGLGWAAAYWSPRLSRRVGQWAAFGMPALVATAYALWLGGRAGGYWGEALPEGAAGEVLRDDWPWLLRLAALASAAFLLHRARRPAPPPENG